MGGEDDRRERRIARRDRTKSPHHRHDDSNDVEIEESGSIDASARRKSAANFSASKLMSNLKVSQETSISRLRRVASTDGMARATGDAARSRRPISRTMSAQASRRPGVERRLRAADTDVLSQSLGDNLGDDDMDQSNMGGSQTNRRRTPQRTKSTDSGPPRGATGRVPRVRRRPVPSDREEATEDLSSEQSHRRRLPARSKSADAFPPTSRAMTRPSRPGRRRNQAPDEEDIIISDSDEEEQDNNNIDRSSRRRGAPPRSKSSHDGPTRGGHRNSRPARRRPSGDSADASPKRPGGGGLQRSLTGTPTTSSSGPGLMRSNTSTNPRSNRTRGGRNTARELAQVAREKEKSPEASVDGFDDHPSSQHQSMSPVKSRQERRRLREGKEREALERRTQGKEMEEEEEQVVGEPEKKEAPWMRRLKKNVEDRAADDPFVRGEISTHTEGNKGCSIPRLDEHAFAVDPTFGVFPEVSNMPLSTIDDGFNDDDGTAHLSIAGGNKLDFSKIS